MACGQRPGGNPSQFETQVALPVLQARRIMPYCSFACNSGRLSETYF
jgi:hypothetical protein